jgi:hypothetical protein
MLISMTVGVIACGHFSLRQAYISSRHLSVEIFFIRHQSLHSCLIRSHIPLFGHIVNLPRIEYDTKKRKRSVKILEAQALRWSCLQRYSVDRQASAGLQ